MRKMNNNLDTIINWYFNLNYELKNKNQKWKIKSRLISFNGVWDKIRLFYG
jgi:hypothetical protein